MSWDPTRPHHHRSLHVDKTRRSPRPVSTQPKPCSVRPDHAHRPRPRTSPQNAHTPPPYQMFLTSAKTLSARSWCLMSTNESAGPTTKIAIESLFDIRPQTCAHVDHHRALTSSPSHPVLAMLYCAFCNASDSPPCHSFPCSAIM